METAQTLPPGILGLTHASRLKPLAYAAPREQQCDSRTLALFDAALQRHLAGDLARAVSLYNQALSADPDYVEAHNNLAAALVAQGGLAEAVARYERAIELRPDYVDAHNNLANALMQLGRVEEAALSYARVLVFDPQNADAHYNMGLVMAAQGLAADAKASYEHALLLDPDHPSAHNNLGNALAAQGEYEGALAEYRQALAIAPEHPQAHNNAGNLLRELGHFDEAAAHYDRALASTPSIAEAHYHRAEIRTFTAGDPALAELQELVRTRQDSPHVHFALAKALEDTGEYQQSFEHLRHGNLLKRRQICYDERADEQLFRRIEQVFDAELLKRLAASGDTSAAPIFVVGMPRSGTTLVEQILASHPEVHGAGELENLAALAPRQFPECMKDAQRRDLLRLGRAYVSGLPRAAGGQTRIVNKLPQNFLYAGLIRLILPNARIIHVTRSAVDTCLSCYSKLFAAGQHFSYDLAEIGRYYRRYEGLMNHWRGVLPKGWMLDVSYEDVVNDIEGESRRMLEFCGLKWNERCLRFHETARPVKTASAVQVRQPLFRSSLYRWRRYEDQIRPLLDALAGE